MGNCCGPQKAYNEPPDEVETPPSTADAPATPSGPLARDGPKSVVLACLDGPSDTLTAHLRAKPELEELRIEAQAEFNFFSAPTERSRLMGTAYDSKQVNVSNHLKVQTVLPTRGIPKITTRQIPGKLIAGPYPAAYYADLDSKTSQPHTYNLHATAMAEDVGSCAIEHGVAPYDASVIYKAPCVNVCVSDNSFPILNRGEWVKQVKQPNLAPLHLFGQEQ